MSQYASIADLYRYGFREEARGDLVDEVLTAHLVSASTVVDGHLGQRYGQPLSIWTNEVTHWVCQIATFTIMTGPRGVSEESPDIMSLKVSYDSAMQFLRRTQRQDYTPVGLTPLAAPSGTMAHQPLVLSNDPRGW